ncbi:hypothetical protein T12_7763 [Trichinella patagoniensis]|uniref:Uncharacterized protein n=1 Tax=Trichinella patagoniensis TaxID=990121 RepID=A0A0V0ZJT0_9BILA|nr:hypothetical protein T12_7763 [Trichinella patagoniensis]
MGMKVLAAHERPIYAPWLLTREPTKIGVQRKMLHSQADESQ